MAESKRKNNVNLLYCFCWFIGLLLLEMDAKRKGVERAGCDKAEMWASGASVGGECFVWVSVWALWCEEWGSSHGFASVARASGLGRCEFLGLGWCV